MLSGPERGPSSWIGMQASSIVSTLDNSGFFRTLDSNSIRRKQWSCQMNSFHISNELRSPVLKISKETAEKISAVTDGRANHGKNSSSTG